MKKHSPHSQTGFSLVEVALALGVASFCLVSIFGLVPIGVNTNRASFEQTSAANVASAVATDLRAIAFPLSTTQNTPYYQVQVPPLANPTTLYVQANGAPTVTTSGSDPSQVSHYRVTLYFTTTGTAPAGTNNPNATAVRILVTWPPQADPAAAKPQFAGSFETFTGLVATN